MGTEDVLRGEIHFGYVTFVIILLSFAYSGKYGEWEACIYWGLATALTMLVALYADTHQHQHEVRQFRKFQSRVVKNLKALKLLKAAG